MAKTTTEAPMTVKAVIAYAEQLRARAHRIRASDPYLEHNTTYPYGPTDGAARREYTRQLVAIQNRDHDQLATVTDVDAFLERQRAEAAERAISELRDRWQRREAAWKQDEQTADRSLARLRRRREAAQRDTDAQRAGLTLGQRLDAALAEASVVAAPGASQLNGDRVHGGDRGVLADHGDPAARVRDVAYRAVRDAEAMVEGLRRRDLGRAA